MGDDLLHGVIADDGEAGTRVSYLRPWQVAGIGEPVQLALRTVQIFHLPLVTDATLGTEAVAFACVDGLTALPQLMIAGHVGMVGRCYGLRGKMRAWALELEA